MVEDGDEGAAWGAPPNILNAAREYENLLQV
jgi:hypothetical protein